MTLQRYKIRFAFTNKGIQIYIFMSTNLRFLKYSQIQIPQMQVCIHKLKFHKYAKNRVILFLCIKNAYQLIFSHLKTDILHIYTFLRAEKLKNNLFLHLQTRKSIYKSLSYWVLDIYTHRYGNTFYAIQIFHTHYSDL